MAPSESEPSIIIGIDFGTTYSGVAWTRTGKPDHTEVITSWESRLYNNQDDEKTPTAIHYGSKSRGGEDITWGYDVPEDKAAIRWFKLLLVDTVDLPPDVRSSPNIARARDLLNQENKTVVETISVYLRNLWNHSIDVISRSVGKSVVNLSVFHVVITLPAIWPQYARARMREAVEQAGILRKRLAGKTTLAFVTEPEAAALATLADMAEGKTVKKGDNFVVVDCGGGTTDIISYNVVSVDPMTVKEVVKGQGALCGAIFADEAFSKLLETKFDRKAWAKMSSAKRTLLLQEEWEYGIKRHYDGRERSWTIDTLFECLDASKRRGLRELPTIKLTAREVRAVFHTVTNQIADMVFDQIRKVQEAEDKKPKFVILVGGFGRCRFLYEDLKKRLSEHKLELLQSRGGRPWTAICRGAVIHATTARNLNSAFKVGVKTRIARASYGIGVTEVPWDCRKHLAEDRVWDEARQSVCANNQIEWFLREGQHIDETTPAIRHSYLQYFQNHGPSKSVSIFISQGNHLPSRTTDSSVKKLCDIEWEKKIDISDLPTFTNDIGTVYSKFKSEVEMTCTAGSIDFAVYHDGKRQGSKNITVDFQDVGCANF